MGTPWDSFWKFGKEKWNIWYGLTVLKWSDPSCNYLILCIAVLHFGAYTELQAFPYSLFPRWLDFLQSDVIEREGLLCYFQKVTHPNAISG